MTADAVLHILIIALVILLPVALVSLLIWYFKSSRGKKDGDGDTAHDGRKRTKD